MKILRFFIVFLLVQSIFFTTTANAAVGGWTMSNPIASGASTVYTGTKQLVINGADYIKKGTAKITPPASGVAKVLGRGVAGYALSVAVEQLLGAVDWVLDPANNQIVYKDLSPASPIPPNVQYYYYYHDSNIGKFVYSGSLSSAASSLCAMHATRLDKKCDSVTTGPDKTGNSQGSIPVYPVLSGSQYNYTVTRSLNPAYDPTVENEDKKTLPLDVVAQKVISNAESGDTNAQVATGAAAADIVSEAEADQTGVKARPIVQQLEDTSTTKPADEAAAEKANEATGEQTKNPDKPDTTDLKLTFPIFCNWAPTVCEAAQTVISFPKTLTNWWETGKEKAEGWATSITESWTAVKEWAKSEEPEDTELEISEPEQPEIDTDIAFGGQCPADHEAQINMGVGTIKMPISYEPICTTVSTAKPVLIFVGFFIAALIIGGVKTE